MGEDGGLAGGMTMEMGDVVRFEGNLGHKTDSADGLDMGV